MAEPTALYRHFAADGSLLYVGISLNVIARLVQHRAKSPWYDEIARIEIERFPSCSEAEAAERIAIDRENPKHNTARLRPHGEKPFEPSTPMPRFLSKPKTYDEWDRQVREMLAAHDARRMEIAEHRRMKAEAATAGTAPSTQVHGAFA